MDTFYKIIKSISISKDQNHLRKLFHNLEVDLSDTQYFEIINKLKTQTDKVKQINKKYLSTKVEKEHDNLILLRFSYLLNLSLSDENGELGFIKNFIHRFRSKKNINFTIAQQKFSNLYQEYTEKLYTCKLRDCSNNLILDIILCTQILKLFEMTIKMEFIVQISFKKVYNPIFKSIRKLMMKNVAIFLRILEQFIKKYSQLILKNHEQAQSINEIYQKALFFNREVDKFRKLKYQEIKFPSITFDKEINRCIEKKVRQLGISKKINTMRDKEETYIRFSLEDDPLI